MKSNLSWDKNCQNVIKKTNERTQLIRNVIKFGATRTELVHLWIVFCRSVLEQSCAVWHSMLSQENKEDLERMQKIFVKLVLKNKFTTYDTGLLHLNLETLEMRRERLCLKFAKDSMKNNKFTDIIKESEKLHSMQMRQENEYKVTHANTERLKNSSVIHFQKIMNSEEKRKRKRE